MLGTHVLMHIRFKPLCLITKGRIKIMTTVYLHLTKEKPIIYRPVHINYTYNSFNPAAERAVC